MDQRLYYLRNSWYIILQTIQFYTNCNVHNSDVIIIHSFLQRVQPSAGQRSWKQDVESERKTYGLLSEVSLLFYCSSCCLLYSFLYPNDSLLSFSWWPLLPLFFHLSCHFPSNIFIFPLTAYISHQNLSSNLKNYNVVTFCFSSEGLHWIHAKIPTFSISLMWLNIFHMEGEKQIILKNPPAFISKQCITDYRV